MLPKHYINGDTSNPKNIILFFHGYGGNGQNVGEIMKHYTDHIPNTVFIYPNGLSPLELHTSKDVENWDFLNEVSYNNSYQWFSLLDRSEEVIGKKVMEITSSVEDLIDEQCKTFGVPHNNVILAGFSQGASLSLHMGLTMKHKVACILPVSGWIARKAINWDKINNVPVYFIHGEADTVVPIDASYMGVELLSSLSIDAKLHAIPKLEHEINDEVIKIAVNIFQSHIAK